MNYISFYLLLMLKKEKVRHEKMRHEEMRHKEEVRSEERGMRSDSCFF